MLAGLKNSASKLCLGCWSFGGGDVWGQQSLEDSREVVSIALDNQVVTLDTAELYNEGRSEACLGDCLRGIRQKAVIATEAGPGNLSKTALSGACERSLKRLRTDYIDLYQVHWPESGVPLSETFEAMENLKAAGKIRQYGVCNFGVRDISALDGKHRPMTNQVAYNLLFRAVEFGIANASRSAGMTLVAYSPLAQGLLTGKYNSIDEVPPSLARTRLFSGKEWFVDGSTGRAMALSGDGSRSRGRGSEKPQADNAEHPGGSCGGGCRNPAKTDFAHGANQGETRRERRYVANPIENPMSSKEDLQLDNASGIV